ncbi:MAG: hypothetical protein JWN38_249 [Candidatus Saccharibacteria bacterium]|nr:hypothetical protein [Candidatus Saccharibacteria bacterium]
MKGKSGSTAECLADLARRYSLAEATDLLVDFASSDKKTVERWFTGTNLPQGERLLQVRCFLWLARYEPREFMSMPPLNRRFALLLALGVVPFDDVIVALGYSGHNGLYDIVLRGRDTMPTRRHQLNRLVENHFDEIEQRKGEWRDKIKQLKEILPLADPTQEVAVSPEPTPIADLPAVKSPAPSTPPEPVASETPSSKRNRRRRRSRGAVLLQSDATGTVTLSGPAAAPPQLEPPALSPEASADLANARMLSHLLLAADELIPRLLESEDAMQLFQRRFAANRLLALRAFADRALPAPTE